MSEYCRILIIDDEFIMRQGLKHMMNWEEAGYQIVGEASNGEEGLEKMKELRPHIILCDIVMPKMDGMDFVNVVQKLYPDVQIIILSGYDNFEYVKNTLLSGAVDYMLKPTLNPAQLLGVLDKAAARIPGLHLEKDREFHFENALKRWLLGFDHRLDQKKFQERFPWDCYRIFAVNLKRESAQDRKLSLALSDYLMRFWEKQNMPNLLFEMQENYLCALINYPANKGMAVKGKLQDMTDKACALCKDFFCAVSAEAYDLETVKKFYQMRLLKETDQAFYYREVHLLFLAAEEEKENAPHFDFHRYTVLLETKRFRDALEMLRDYSQESLRVKADAQKLKNQVKNMIYNLLDTLGKGENQELDQFRYQAFKVVDKAAYEQEFRKKFQEICDSLESYITKAEGQENGRINEILDYISHNYGQDLDLAEIAGVFNFNYNYLSSFFNQYMPEGYSGYLNRVRIEQACRLLDENKLPISQVSSKVGYSDHSYFCRVFKKLTGETPSGWRRRSVHDQRHTGTLSPEHQDGAVQKETGAGHEA